jgi:hypothetical protein
LVQKSLIPRRGAPINQVLARVCPWLLGAELVGLWPWLGAFLWIVCGMSSASGHLMKATPVVVFPVLLLWIGARAWWSGCSPRLDAAILTILNLVIVTGVAWSLAARLIGCRQHIGPLPPMSVGDTGLPLVL